MEGIKVEEGGGYNGVHNLWEIEQFMEGEEFGYLITGGGSRKKKTKWAKLQKILIVQNGRKILVNKGDYLCRTNAGNYISLTEQEYKELV